MILGFDGSRAFGEKKRTGTENYSYYLLRELAKIDRKNRYIVYLRPGALFKAQEWPKNFEFKVIRFPRLWTQVGLAAVTFLDGLDLLFVPSHTLPLIRKPGLKTIMTVHDLGSEYLPGLHQLKQALYLRAITKFQLKTATRLIAVSKATRDDLINKVGISKEKIELIYEGVDRSVFKNPGIKDVEKTMKKYGLKKSKYFLFVGTIQPRKNLIRLIEAFYRLSSPSQILVLAGKKGWLAEDIYKLPVNLGIQEKVRFLDFVPSQDLSNLYSGANAFVFPSLFEGFGLPILEAFALNCPVLTSNVSSMPEVAGDAAILVNPYSVESIKEGMITVSEPNTAQLLRKKGLKQLEKFSWKSSAKETLRLFKEIIND